MTLTRSTVEAYLADAEHEPTRVLCRSWLKLANWIERCGEHTHDCGTHAPHGRCTCSYSEIQRAIAGEG